MKTDQTISFILRVAAIATLLIGLATLFIPGFIIQIFDGYDVNNFHFVRFVGTALIGFAVTNWMYSMFHDMRSVLPAIYGNLTSLIIAVGVDIIGLVSQTLSRAAWIILLVHLLFAGAFIYCVWLIKKHPANS